MSYKPHSVLRACSPSIVIDWYQKAPDVYLHLGALYHMTAVTGDHSGHVIRMPTSASQREGVKLPFFAK